MNGCSHSEEEYECARKFVLDDDERVQLEGTPADVPETKVKVIPIDLLQVESIRNTTYDTEHGTNEEE